MPGGIFWILGLLEAILVWLKNGFVSCFCDMWLPWHFIKVSRPVTCDQQIDLIAIVEGGEYESALQAALFRGNESIDKLLLDNSSTSRCPSHSCRNVRIPLESTGMGPESTGIQRNETGFRRNYCIPAGIELESTGMTLFLQEWNILNKIAYIYIFAYIY